MSRLQLEIKSSHPFVSAVLAWSFLLLACARTGDIGPVHTTAGTLASRIPSAPPPHLTSPELAAQVPVIRPDTNLLRRLVTDTNACMEPRTRLAKKVEILRPGGGVALPDGRIAILDRDNVGIVIFDGDGNQLRRFGKKGNGPGEFNQTASIVKWNGDTIAITDQQTMRLTFFSPDGRLLGHINLGEIGGLWSPTFIEGTTRDGLIYALVYGSQTRPSRGRSLYRDTAEVKTFRIGARRADLFRPVLGASMSRGPARSDWVLQAGFQKNTMVQVSDAMIAVVDNATSRAELYSPEGKLTAILDIGLALPAVSADDVKEYLKRARENVGESIYASARDAFRWDSVHAVIAGIALDKKSLWMHLQSSTYAKHSVWAQIQLDGAITRCISNEDDAKIVALGTTAAFFSKEVEDSMVLIRREVGTIRASRPRR